MLIHSAEENTSMALGEVLGEARGKVAGLKALGDGKIEVSLQGKGKLLGSDMDDVVTFWSVMRPNGTAYGKGNAVDMSTDGMAWQNGVVQGLADLQDPVRGSIPTAVSLQMLRLRNGRDCLMFILRENMKMTLTEITSGKFGSGNTD